jgi:hypothetical protein
MKQLLRGAAIAAVAIGSFTACNMDYFQTDNFAGGSYRPTFAVPIANINITVGQLLKQFENNIVLTEDPSDTSRSFLTLIFSDTLKAITMDQFGSGATIPAGAEVQLPKEKVDLRIFGNIKDGAFTLTDPSVTFELDNSTSTGYTVEFRDGVDTNFYTYNVNTSKSKFLEVTDANHPFPVDANSKGSFSLDNNNLQNVDVKGEPLPGKAMTDVMEPTPKYLYYGINLKTTESTSSLGGEVGVIANVFLPLQGYGNVTRRDTFKYEFLDTDTISEVQVNFVELRVIINNGLPLEGKLSNAIVVDTTTSPWTQLMEIELAGEDGNPTDGILIPAATDGTADFHYTSQERLSDIILSNFEMVQPVNFANQVPVGNEISQVEAIARGNKIMIDVQIITGNNPEEIKMYSDQSMNIRLALRAQANLDLGAILSDDTE